MDLQPFRRSWARLKNTRTAGLYVLVDGEYLQPMDRSSQVQQSTPYDECFCVIGLKRLKRVAQ